MGDVIATKPCPLAGCDGVMTFKNTKPTRARGIVKIIGSCTNGHNDNFSSAKMQKMMRAYVEKESTENDYVIKDDPQDIDLPIDDEPSPKKSRVGKVVGLCLAFAGSIGFITWFRKKRNEQYS